MDTTTNSINLAAVSDLHGDLPEIQSCDVVCICGDIVPLEIQNNYNLSEYWFRNDFIDWAKALPCEKVIFIGGNHDFMLETATSIRINSMIKQREANDKVIYLENSEYNYRDKIFYGCPNVQDMYGWAFNMKWPYDQFARIPDCNVLLTHQPPAIGDIGRSLISLYDWGSIKLRNTIDKRDIDYVFCGHVHSGDHHLIEYRNTKVQNVSIKDDDYNNVFDVTYLTI